MLMKHYRIHTPVPGHSEVIGTVSFVNGVAECEAEPTAAPLMYFRAQGYTIEEQDEDGEWVPEAPLPPRKRATVDRLGDLEEENAALRDQLAAAITSSSRAPADPAAKPKGNASRDAWRAWAVDHGGMSAEEADELSRDELVARFADEENGS